MPNETIIFNRKKKRATSQETIIQDERLYPYLVKLCNKLEYPYKLDAERLNRRDKALFAFIFLSGCRVSETLKIQRKQISIYSDHLELTNVKPLKRGNIRTRIIFPKSGSLAPLTEIFAAWFVEVKEEEDYLFPQHDRNAHFRFDKSLTRRRAYGIVRRSGMFPHWGRAVCETIYGRRVFRNDVFKLARFMGIKNIDNLVPYVQATWEENIEDIYKL